MAVATSTALLIGAGVSAAGAGTSFIQAGKARREANKAAEKAGEALQEARDKLQVNYLKGLSIQKEPYELAREAGISTGAQIVQAAQEGDQRGAVAGASRAALAAQQMQNQNRIAMGQELQSLQRAAANEDRNLQRQLVGLDKQEVMGFQNMAADQRARQRELNQAGAQGLVSAGIQAMQAVPLFSDSSVQFPTETVGDQIVSTKLIDDPNSRFFRTPNGVVDISQQFQANMPTVDITPLPSVSILPDITPLDTTNPNYSK
tara:strand:+ start:2253 stop:3035 length:783 start_codon:yes stop_codon:yes gene_type:complete